MESAQLDSQIVELRDGSSATIRPIQPDDVDSLVAMHERLSKHSKVLRYLVAPKHLPEYDIRQICQIDYCMEMVLVASSVNAPQDVIALASYAATEEVPDEAEITILVEDAWQGHGLGTLLLERLTAYAVLHGIHTFTAFVNKENKQILNFVEQSILPSTRVLTQGIWKISISLPSPGQRKWSLRRIWKQPRR
jgi:RimJ/RimL family protein N-acetyltransferase